MSKVKFKGENYFEITEAFVDLAETVTEEYAKWDEGQKVDWDAVASKCGTMLAVFGDDIEGKEEQDYRDRERNNEQVYDDEAAEERKDNISLQENDRAKATTKKFQYNLKESDRGLREEFENGDATIDVVLGDFSRRESEEVYNVLISVLAYKIDIGDDDYYDVYYVEGDKRDLYYFLYDFVDMEHDEIYQTYPGLFEGVDSANDMYE